MYWVAHRVPGFKGNPWQILKRSFSQKKDALPTANYYRKSDRQVLVINAESKEDALNLANKLKS